MDAYVLDIYLDDVNKRYLNKITFMALFRSRSLGFRCASEMFCEAYRNYNETITEGFLHTLETVLISKYIVNHYEIVYREDLHYMLRHPEKLDIPADKRQKPVRKKVLQFFDLEQPGNEYKMEAFNYLKSMRPVKRAAAIDAMLEQYLIMSQNEYYIKQAASSLLRCIIEHAKFNEDGILENPENKLVDTIWLVGTRS